MFPTSPLQQGSMTINPGANGQGTALGFKDSSHSIIATQKITADRLLPNTTYLLKANFLSQKDKCILALRSDLNRNVLMTVAAPDTANWKELGTTYTTSSKPEDIDVELHMGTNTGTATCALDDITFGPVNTSTTPTDNQTSDDDTVDPPIDVVTPSPALPTVFSGGETTLLSGISGGSADQLTYHWYFGDGSSADGDPESNGDISHTYAQPGEYRATLTVSDPASGQTRTSTTPVNVMPDIHDMPSTRATHMDQAVDRKSVV